MRSPVHDVVRAPFPELASALRARLDEVVRAWEAAVREAVPRAGRLALEEVRDSIPRTLAAVAEALGSGDADAVAGALAEAPAHGLARLHQGRGVAELSQEGLLLRAAGARAVEAELGRALGAAESAALHGAFDAMLLGAVTALVDEEEVRLREAAERELKYLAFLSHDLRNHLTGVAIHLRLLRDELAALAAEATDAPTGAEVAAGAGPVRATVGPAAPWGEAVERIAAAERGIAETVAGMGRLLEHERLRKGAGDGGRREAVDLAALLASVAREQADAAGARGLTIEVEADAGPPARTDPALLAMALRNLAGNAVKYAAGGRVTLSAARPPAGAGPPRWRIAVSDRGPGIAPEHRQRIFEAFRRGEPHGQEGVGLGLAIVAQATRALGAELSLESEVGRGTTFRIDLPPD